MELGKILEFRKDLYFEGAVQADWFYSPERASKVAENFVFHGNTYFGIEDQGLGTKKRIDTISLVEELVGKCYSISTRRSKVKDSKVEDNEFYTNSCTRAAVSYNNSKISKSLLPLTVVIGIDEKTTFNSSAVK